MLKTKSVSYPKGEYLSTVQELLKGHQPSFVWLDASVADVDTLRAQFPDHHLNPLQSVFHRAIDRMIGTKQLVINLRQAVEYHVTEDHRLVQPMERATLSLAGVLKDLCVAYGLSERCWEQVYAEWIDESSDDFFVIDEYLYNGEIEQVESQTFKSLGAKATVRELIHKMSELWTARLATYDDESCGLVYVVECKVSDILQKFKTRHSIYARPDIDSYLSEQIRRAPHRGDQRLMSGLNLSCFGLSIQTLDLLQDSFENAQPVRLHLVEFGDTQTNPIELFLLDVTPIQLHVHFGLDETHVLTLDPSQLKSPQLDRPVTLTALYHDGFAVLLTQNSSSVLSKVSL